MTFYVVHTPVTLRMKGKGVQIYGYLCYKVNDFYFNCITNKRMYNIEQVNTL